ncbi:RNA polymerase sigma factor [Dokdonella sp.]|uniref:RNA polymerase sigma factor n=1 Tax=Dokdonella sp. TaxID=2291710 RepID=UPI0035280263
MNNAAQGCEASRAESDDECELKWLHAIALGDRTAFERLYLRYHPPLTRFLIHSAGRPDLVDDVINETLWAVWRGAVHFRGDSKPRTWIVSIAYRTLMKHLRDRSRGSMLGTRDVAEAEHPANLIDVESGPDMAEQREWLSHGLSLLPDEQRMTLELAYLLGQSCEEIAEIMDCAIGTVKARMFRARVRLRNTLPGLAGENGPETEAEQA